MSTSLADIQLPRCSNQVVLWTFLTLMWILYSWHLGYFGYVAVLWVDYQLIKPFICMVLLDQLVMRAGLKEHNMTMKVGSRVERRGIMVGPWSHGWDGKEPEWRGQEEALYSTTSTLLYHLLCSTTYSTTSTLFCCTAVCSTTSTLMYLPLC